MKVTVCAACTATPRTQPVSLHSPEGMSTATTGSPLAFIAAIACACASRTGPPSPVPSSASTITPASKRVCGVNGRTSMPAASAACERETRVTGDARLLAEQRYRHRQAAIGREPCHDEPVAAVVAGATDHVDRQHAAASRAPAARTPRARRGSSARCPECRRRSIAARSSARVSAAVYSAGCGSASCIATALRWTGFHCTRCLRYACRGAGQIPATRSPHAAGRCR